MGIIEGSATVRPGGLIKDKLKSSEEESIRKTAISLFGMSNTDVDSELVPKEYLEKAQKLHQFFEGPDQMNKAISFIRCLSPNAVKSILEDL